jgi:holo-[acyl-carrier protein] synthase
MHPNELKHRRIGEVEYVAGRWAVKESVVKCLGSIVLYNEVETTNNWYGAPKVALYGKAKEKADRMGVENSMVTITHEKDYAIAFVMLLGSEDPTPQTERPPAAANTPPK